MTVSPSGAVTHRPTCLSHLCATRAPKGDAQLSHRRLRTQRSTSRSLSPWSNKCMHTRSFTAARECVFSDKRSCPINLNGTHLGIVLNDQTDSSHYSQRVHSTNHYRGKAIVAFGPKAPLVSTLVPLITGRFCSSA